MTSKQSDFIARLVAEKNLPADDARTAFLANAANLDRLDVAAASRAIDWLMSLPNTQARTATGATVEVEAGRYALVAADGTVKFYRVDCPDTGKWAGWTFVKAQASDDEWPIKNASEKARILAEIAADPHTAMIRYGHEIGCCGRCGRTLTDEDSRAAGIGPDCAKILGIDRTGASEAARAERVASLLADTGEEDEVEDPAIAQGYDTDYSAVAADMSDADDLAADLIERTAPKAPRVTAPAARLTWRERKAEVAANRPGSALARAAAARKNCSQLDELPGETWEDIFQDSPQVVKATVAS